MDGSYADQIGRSISLIDHKIHSLVDISLPLDVVHLNLHCNEIVKIEALHYLKGLRSLDLSSNKVEKIEGLESSSNLQVLNLSCNQIQVINGLGSLRKLEYLNLSYNVIHDLSGLKDFRRNTHSIKNIELHGNQISSLKHLIESISNCGTLEILSLERNGDSNPVCRVPAYLSNIFAQVASLVVLDGKDKHGIAMDTDNIPQTAHHPGLDEYLQWLVEPNPSDSSTTIEKSESQLDIETPKIDQALHRFRGRSLAKPTTVSRGHLARTKEELSEGREVTERLGFLEKQIESLLQLQLQKQMVPEKDTTITTTATTSPSNDEEKIKPTRQQRGKVIVKKVNEAEIKQRGVAKRMQSCLPVRGNTVKGTKSSGSDEIKKATRKVRDPKDDEAALMMLQELDEERERRWKAEQATRRLVNTVKEMQEKIAEERKIAETAISASAKLKTALASERDEKADLERHFQDTKAKCEDLNEELQKLRKYEEDARKIIGSLEETSRSSERERLKVQALKDKQLQEAQFKAASTIREAELLQENVKNLKQRVSQLQELLASREHDHKTTVEGMVRMDGKEIKDIIEKEIAKQEGRYAQLIQQYNERIEERNRDYAALEDEFRTGLQMEASRFAELQEAYSRLVDESSELRRSLQHLKQKESKSASLVTELTSMVKEQKGRLAEISKSKQEMQADVKERIQSLEDQLNGSRKQLSKMETFRQEKDKLLAQVKAQESVIEGLHMERKLWGQELAQQGASLAQDRGRLEAQIEALASQVKQLKQREQENIDTLKIKTKLVEDQTDTIKKLKQELTNQKSELKKAKDDILADKGQLEEELEEEKKHSHELQDAIELLQGRKEDLKTQLGVANKELEKTRDELRNLKKQWEERSQMIGQLEQKVVKMKDNFEAKEQNLREERDAALKSANSTREKLKTCDNSFRRQLDEVKREHELVIRRVIAEKDDEIGRANSKVSEVEDEMRILLEDTALSKRNLEMKVKQLSKAFSEVQLDLGS